ncbi:MAG: phospho-sugar mutase [Peptococcaceae bacterium]|jgi:phosphoglucomutase|nr:phospho-sugar mutase [Peptococcaceae bacterium]
MSGVENVNYKEVGEASRKAWLESPYVDEDTKATIRLITDETDMEESFGQDLAFGTGGMRGVMGPGNMKMNPYTVRRAIKGVALWLKQMGPEAMAQGAAIAYDTRHHSEEFARHTAVTLAEEGVKVYLTDRPTPTPVLSNAIRKYGCATGVVITASHNMKEYNGMKIYNHYGCQLPPDEAQPLMDVIGDLPLFSPLPEEDFDSLVKKGRIELLGEDLLHAYTDTVLSHSLLDDAAAKAALSVVYTPLNGSGNLYIRETLAKDGFTQVLTVPEQELPDGGFSTVKQPNPEETEALTMAINLATKKGAHIVVGSDPDSDRLGTAILHDGEFRNITGNQIGVLLTDYVLTRRKILGTLPEHGVFINTIVTCKLGEVIAKAYGLDVVKCLTGFKFIGEQMAVLEEAAASGDDRTFVFGYEESNGYLIADFVRDKDAVGATMLFCEAAAYWLAQGKTMLDRLEEIYQTYGLYMDLLDTFVIPGFDGLEKMKKIMDELRESGEKILPDVEKVEDFLLGIDGIPKDNVLRFQIKGDCWLAVRPSGTEPKLKAYYSILADTPAQGLEKQEQLRKVIREMAEK